MSYSHEQIYKEYVCKELVRWERKFLQRPGLLELASKKVQNKINDKVIPKKIQTIITATVKGLVNNVLFGLKFIPKSPPLINIPLQERDRKAENLLLKYKRLAAAEGAGTGAGGIALSLADFPGLIAIKMKFIFELAHIYGFSTKNYLERLFILFVFQLAFSSSEKRQELYNIISNWEKISKAWTDKEGNLKHIDWEQFQREYRDAIDLRKTLQLIPGLGTIIGAWANYSLLDDLGRVGINCYRLRILGGVNIDKGNSTRD